MTTSRLKQKPNVTGKNNFNSSDFNLFEMKSPIPRLTSFIRKFRAIRRIILILAWTFFCMPVQACLLKLHGNWKVRFICVYWRNVSRLFGMKTRIFGTVVESGCYKTEKKQDKRPVIYIANHTSWLDIPVMGGIAPGAFVAKEEIKNWPLISTLCKLGRVLFVSRQRQNTKKEQISMQQRLKEDKNLILFPEGTSTNGSHLLPFLSSFFVLAKPLNNKQTDYPIPIIQPVSIVYDHLNMLPVNRRQRVIYSWFGDMELAPHLWQLSQWYSMRCSLIFHDPLYPEDFESRKDLAFATWNIVANGTAALRQTAPDVEIHKTISFKS